MEHLISAYIEERVSEIIIPSADILVDVLHKDSLNSIYKKQTTLLDPKTKIKMIVLSLLYNVLTFIRRFLL